MIRRTRRYPGSGESFSIETTLSGGGYLETMRQAAERGFLVRLIYICTDHAEENVQRVRARFSLGGMMCLMEMSGGVTSGVWRTSRRRLAHEAWLYDNSGDQSQLVLEARDGAIVWRAADQPAWVVASGLLN